jgi:uncharacterized protein (DUF1697 family)
VALLRGVNVGGKRAVAMAALKACLEQQRFEEVATYIQSGNVIFQTRDRTVSQITNRIEAALQETFGFDVPIVLKSRPQLKAVVEGAPAGWKRRADLRR